MSCNSYPLEKFLLPPMIQTMYEMKVVAAKGCFRDILRSFHSLSQRLMLTFLKKAKIPLPYSEATDAFVRKGQWLYVSKSTDLTPMLYVQPAVSVDLQSIRRSVLTPV